VPQSHPMNRKILIILHQEHSTTGRIGHRLVQRGYSLDIRKPRFGDPLPETLAEHDGVMVFGGPMSANDTDEYVRRETEWSEVPLKEEKPFLGICLGAQILARALGAEVAFHPKGLVEVGYYPLRATPEGAALLDWPDYVYQWHREGFDLPAGAVRLAESDAFPNQAFRYGPAAFGIQFHCELTHHMMCRWTTRGHERLTLPGAQPRVAHFEGRALHDAKTCTWLDEFLDLWTGLARPGAGAARRPAASQIANAVAK
jgi:GMP synthase (glutamine-hydrolysing)